LPASKRPQVSLKRTSEIDYKPKNKFCKEVSKIKCRFCGIFRNFITFANCTLFLRILDGNFANVPKFRENFG